MSTITLKISIKILLGGFSIKENYTSLNWDTIINNSVGSQFTTKHVTNLNKDELRELFLPLIGKTVDDVVQAMSDFADKKNEMQKKLEMFKDNPKDFVNISSELTLIKE